jgi:hypothetical protein
MTRLSDIQQVIARSTIAEIEASTRRESPPNWIDLDPAVSLFPRDARLDRLIRSVCVDDGLLTGDSLSSVCKRVGEQQVPAANRTLRAEAEAWLNAWPATSLFEELRDAARTTATRARSLAWTIPWRTGADSSSVLRGSCDAIYRDRLGRWRPLTISTRQGEDVLSRLRLMLSIVAAESANLSPVGPGWLVRRGVQGELVVDVHVSLSADDIGNCLDEWLSSRG